MTIKMIVAHDLNNLIGNQNKLPWHLPEDLQHFKNETLNKNIVMGRKTFESIGRPLPKRNNIILTRDKNYCPENTTVFNSVSEILKSYDNFIVIGGVEIYKQFLPHTNELIVTEIQNTFDGDAYFPEYKNSFDKIKENQFYSDKSNLKYNITYYKNNQ
tara:strand:- start:413 stop:886 length:474 start_codon:yes stop_codon:yes gene_type:complete